MVSLLISFDIEFAFTSTHKHRGDSWQEGFKDSVYFVQSQILDILRAKERKSDQIPVNVFA